MYVRQVYFQSFVYLMSEWYFRAFFAHLILANSEVFYYLKMGHF